MSGGSNVRAGSGPACVRTPALRLFRSGAVAVKSKRWSGSIEYCDRVDSLGGLSASPSSSSE